MHVQETIKQRKQKLAAQRRHNRNRQISYIIHEKLHLTFGQCVHLLDSNHDRGHEVANRNIAKQNEANKDNKSYVPLSNYDPDTFNEKLKELIEFGQSSHEFMA